MLVDRLALEIVVGMVAAIRAGERLRGLVRLETEIALLEIGGAVRLSLARIAQHKVVIGFEVLRVDRKRGLEFTDGVVIAALEKKDTAKVVVHHAIARILSNDLAKMGDRVVIAPLIAKHPRIEVMRAGQMRAHRQRALEHLAG